MQTRHHVISYKTPYHPIEGMCGVSIFQAAPEMAVVVLTEYRGNLGVSVTNAVEFIASKVKRAFLPAVDPDQIIWVERYESHGKLLDEGDPMGETFDLVRLEWENGAYRAPQWFSIGGSRSAADFWKTLFQSDRPLAEFPQFGQVAQLSIE